MAKKKPHRPRGHYCKVCGEYKANEKFSGKGHAAHICKVCAGLSAEERAEKMTLNKLENMFGGGISKEQKKWLENRLHDSRPEVAETARMVYNSCFPYAERNAKKKQLTIDTLRFEVNTEVFMEYGDMEQVHQIFTADRNSRMLTFRDLENGSPEQSITLDGGRMAKLLRWTVHTQEIFMWQEDYCSSGSYDYDSYIPDWEDDEMDEMEPALIEEAEIDPSEITWRVQVTYSNGESQDIRCDVDYLPDKVEELYWELMDYFDCPICDDDCDIEI